MCPIISRRFMTMRRRLSFGLAISALLLASGCDEGGSSGSGSNSGAAAASASSSLSGTSTNPPPSPPPSGSPGVLEASWTAPTTNTDGSPLTDLAFYRLYYGNAGTPCPGSAFLQIASPTPSPQINDILTYTLTGLLTGTQYFVAITAVDSTDLESGCSSVASAVARSGGGAAGGLVGSISGGWANSGSALAIQEPVLTGLTAASASQVPGTTVTFTAIATGGTAPYQFKWWLWDGATWTVLEDWSTSNTFAWTPGTPNPNYAVAVRVRSACSTVDQTDTGAYRVIAFAIN